MRTKGLILGLMLALVAAIGIFAIAAAAQKPMTGRITLAGGPVADCSRGMLIGATGQGALAHIGVVGIATTNCTGVENNVEATRIWDANALFQHGDGSTIRATFEGAQEAPQGDTAEYTITLTITGGTGRFSGAAGTWTITGTIDFSTGTLVGDVSGWFRS